MAKQSQLEKKIRAEIEALRVQLADLDTRKGALEQRLATLLHLLPGQTEEP